jgi:transposase
MAPEAIVEAAMAQRKQNKSPSTSALPPQLATVNRHAAGIDVGADTPDVAVPPPDDPQPVRGFGACTADLEALADWWAACGVTTVALESTGVSWSPLFEWLEPRGFEVILVDPQQGHRLTGRPKHDGHAGQWWQRLHTVGLLAGAFRPADHVWVRRRYLRQRAMLLTSAGQHLQHRPKAVTPMHLKLPHVVSAITGVTGRAMIRAMLAGERHPVQVAQRRDDRGHHDQEASAKALRGQWREEPLLALAQAVALAAV